MFVLRKKTILQQFLKRDPDPKELILIGMRRRIVLRCCQAGDAAHCLRNPVQFSDKGYEPPQHATVKLPDAILAYMYKSFLNT